MRSAAKSSAIVAQPGARPPGTTTRPVRTWRTRVPTGPSLGSRVARTATRPDRSRSARRPTCVVVPAPSIPSSTTNLPRREPIGTGYPSWRRTGRDHGKAPSRRRARARSAEHAIVDEPRRSDAARDRENGGGRHGLDGGETVGIAELDVVDGPRDTFDRLAGQALEL